MGAPDVLVTVTLVRSDAGGSTSLRTKLFSVTLPSLYAVTLQLTFSPTTTSLA